MDSSIHRALLDKVYEKRKNAARDLEKTVREAAAQGDVKKLHHIIAQLIALGPKIAEYLGAIVPPILGCFSDTDSKVRYFACESMYNVAKVAKGEILIFFNELFDAMSKLAADTELSVKNGAELLDRLIKDIVSEEASTYVSVTAYSPVASPAASTSSLPPADEHHPGHEGESLHHQEKPHRELEKAFSLPRFVPLLRERIYVLNPFTRTFLVSWLTLLDSVPELELVSFLPDFLDGLLKYLGDPTADVRTATQNLLADFLKEIREIAEVEREIKERSEGAGGRRGSSIRRAEDSDGEEGDDGEDWPEEDEDEEDSGEWIPGQGVEVHHAAIVEILLVHLSFPDEEIQSTCLRWIAEFLLFCQPTMVPLTPRLLPVILSSLAHHVASIRTAANETNYNLHKVVQELPVSPLPADVPTASPVSVSQARHPDAPGRDRTLTASPQPTAIPFPSLNTNSARTNSSTSSTKPHPPPTSDVVALGSQFEDSLSIEHKSHGGRESVADSHSPQESGEPFDYGATVNALTLQFLSEHEETRVAALEWLLMLHQKAPKRILAMDEPTSDTRSASAMRSTYDGSESGLTIALLLKMLSDPSEKFLRYDLQLLAQISASSEDEYFPSFMMSLLSLFSTDRRLLETRGSLIIRQLCVSLNTERIYRTFAEILEKDEDLEFASIMVQNLNLIMITSPELADFRKRLRTLESKDGQALFTILYRSWSHNAVATFSLCLLAQAYEQACSLLQIFADLEITVSLLIQIDKLVQLLESPVFTSLRLQLLEPEKYPYLLKAMYGLLMLLPQSSAFATLRNRLSAVSSLGFLQTVPKSYASTTTAAAARSTIRRGDDIRWTELLTHFRQVQKRRSSAAVNLGAETLDGVQATANSAALHGTGANAARTQRRKTDGGAPRSTTSRIEGAPTTGARNPNGWRGASGGSAGAAPRTTSPIAKRRLASAPTKKTTGQ
ncbi:ARM repeat-containing protein [Pseudohyphozyma bogoriensis]|nr:ARM repeat-containing protein [Pseudohyphozyma bogoriensis]